MKYTRIFLTLTFFLPLLGWGQTASQEGHIWLANSRGEAVGQADSLVTRNFFDAEWVDVRTDFVIDPSVECWVVLMPEDKSAAKAYKINKQELFPEVLNGIKNQVGDAKVMLLFQPRKGEVTTLQKNKLELRLL
jgi:hypothetical protein